MAISIFLIPSIPFLQMHYNNFMANTTYDDFSQDYDRFVNWKSRLDAEVPFIETCLNELAVANGEKPAILDAACGTGMHTIELARHGYPSAGADLSEKMVEKARLNANAAGMDITFKPAGFGQITEIFREDTLFPFDAILCLGNSLPHLTAEADLLAALTDFNACLKPGGLLILQNRNFDAVMARRDRWIGPQSQSEGGREWLFLRFYDFNADGLITFNILRLKRDGDSPWTQNISTVRLFPLLHNQLSRLLKASGFKNTRFYGALMDIPFDLGVSENLVAVAQKA